MSLKKKKSFFKWIWSERYKTSIAGGRGKVSICRMPIEDKIIIDEFRKLKMEIELAMNRALAKGKKQKVKIGNAEYIVYPCKLFLSMEDYIKQKKQFDKWSFKNWNV